MTKGKIYLIPVTLGESEINHVIPEYNIAVLNTIKDFAVENGKIARAFLKKCNLETKLQHMNYYELADYVHPSEIKSLLLPCLAGKNMGILSDAGCPGIADPGSLLVKFAHREKIQVIPLVGPSSILLTLIASGMSGQSFTFHGYLPREKVDLAKRIKEIEKNCEHQTQIFMETPYRNNQMLTEILSHLHPDTLLCIASNVTLANETIFTQRVSDWKKNKPDLKDQPTMYCISK